MDILPGKNPLYSFLKNRRDSVETTPKKPLPKYGEAFLFDNAVNVMRSGSCHPSLEIIVRGKFCVSFKITLHRSLSMEFLNLTILCLTFLHFVLVSVFVRIIFCLS